MGLSEADRPPSFLEESEGGGSRAARCACEGCGAERHRAGGGGRVRLLGRAGESEGCARVSEGWLAKKVVAWAYEPITDSRISPPMHTRVLMISARVARESAKMHLRNMGYAWSSSIVSTCFLSLCACVSEPHGSQPKIEVPRRTLALPPVRRPDAPRDVGRSEARTLLSTAHTLANLSPNLAFEWHHDGGERRREVEQRHDFDVPLFEAARGAAGKVCRAAARRTLEVHVCDLCVGVARVEGGVRE